MTVRHLSCGTMCPLSRRLINGEGSHFKAGEMVCHCLLIETREGLVLVDTGFGTHDVASPKARLGPLRWLLQAKFQLADTALHQLRALGYAPEDVRHIVLTHLDVDHAGGLSDFPNATVHLLQREKEAAVDAPDLLARQRFRAVQWAHQPRWESYEPEGEAWHGFPCVRSLRGLPPEILLVPLHGHTRGHSCVAVHSHDGWLLHCGDAYYHRASVTPGQHPPAGIRLFQRFSAVNHPQLLANQARLAELGTQRDVRLFCAHDPVELAALRLH
ncbi:MAG: MBL fold metallo-hydrolase [Myxococcota bacterium]